jgi:hypothetical protein
LHVALDVALLWFNLSQGKTQRIICDKAKRCACESTGTILFQEQLIEVGVRKYGLWPLELLASPTSIRDQLPDCRHEDSILFGYGINAT